jgi:mRNA interferase MazF
MTPEPRRGEVWLAKLDKVRPVIVLTRDPMGRHLNSVIVAPVTSTVRGLATEVAVDQ